MGTLCIMVGLSGSGKSSTVKELIKETRDETSNVKGLLGPETVIVSTDAIRGEICEGGVGDQSKNKEVFAIFYNRIRKGLKDGKNVIADATNVSKYSRKCILNCVGKTECKKIAVVIDKSIENCKIDNPKREYPVPDEVIDRQAKNLRKNPVTLDEGFDEIIVVDANETRN